MLTALHRRKLMENKKLVSMARTSAPQIFAESIFPRHSVMQPKTVIWRSRIPIQHCLRIRPSTTLSTIEELESYIVPNIMTMQEVQKIVDTTTTGKDEEEDLSSLTTVIYDKIKKKYKAAELERLGDELCRIFNITT